MNKKIIAGLLILITAVIIYLILHDFTNLQIFNFLNCHASFNFYKVYRTSIYTVLENIPCFFIIKNYLVDILWFISFSLIFTEIAPFPHIIKLFLLFIMAIFSEGSQFFFPQLGTFDCFDLFLYFLIIIFLDKLIY